MLEDIESKHVGLREQAVPEGFEPTRVVNTPTAQRLTGIRSKTWKRLRSRGEGPPAIRLSKQCLGYLTSDLLAWLEARREAR